MDKFNELIEKASNGFGFGDPQLEQNMKLIVEAENLKLREEEIDILKKQNFGLKAKQKKETLRFWISWGVTSVIAFGGLIIAIISLSRGS